MHQLKGCNQANHSKLTGLEWFWFLAACISLTVFCVFKLNHAIYHVPFIDDAWMATIAKNFANGHGWTSSLGSVLPFDGNITTGPGLLLPLAATIKLWGNNTYLPRVFSFLFNLSLLAIFLCVIRSYFTKLQFFRLLAILPLMLSLSNWNLWISSLGDITAMLYLANAAALLSLLTNTDTRNQQLYFMAVIAGLCLGLSILTKFVTLIPACCLILLFSMFYSKHWRFYLVSALVATLLLCSWQLYEYLCINSYPQELQTLIKTKQQAVFLKTGSGLNLLIAAWEQNDLINHIVRNTLDNIKNYQRILNNNFAPLPNMLLPICTATIGMFLYCVFHHKKHASKLYFALIICSGSYLSWAIILGSTNLGRFIAIPLQLSLIIFAILIAKTRFLALVFIIFAAINAAPLWSVHDNFMGFHYQWNKPADRNHQALANLIHLIENQDYKEPVLSCPAIHSREVEYALSGINRVHNCSYFIGHYLAPNPKNDTSHSNNKLLEQKHQFALDVAKQITAVSWTDAVPNYLLVTNPIGNNYPNFHPSPLYHVFKQSCSEKLFAEEGYELWRCQGAVLMQLIDDAGGIGFMPELWQEQLWQAGSL